MPDLLKRTDTFLVNVTNPVAKALVAELKAEIIRQEALVTILAEGQTRLRTDLDAAVKTMKWYQECASSLARYVYGKPAKPEAALAVMTELSLDAGRRASTALGEDNG